MSPEPELEPRGEEGRGLLRGALLVASLAATHALLVLGGDLTNHPSADSYCHASFAADIAQGKLVPDLAKALPWTLFHRLNVDHYWGHHLVTAPFVGAFGLLAGMKVASGFFFVLIPVVMYLLLRARGVPWAPLFALLPLCAPAQDWRYLQLRGGAWMLVLLLAHLHVAFFSEGDRRRRLGLLWFLGYVAMLSYQGGIVLLGFHGAGLLWGALTDRPLFRERRLDLAATALGLVGGLLLNPYVDRQASTFRFAWYHILHMSSDPARLYADWPQFEFQPFPLRLLVLDPLWGLLLALTLGMALKTLVQRARGGAVERDEMVLAGLSLVGVALTARTLRMREYAVPVALLFLAVAARPWLRRVPRKAAVLAPLLGGLLLLVRASTTLGILSIERIPAETFAAARPLLEANGPAPILNLAESDFCHLRWAWPGVVCVQALSRYFLWPDRELYREVRTLHEQADTSPGTALLLQKFRNRGVNLVVTHNTHRLHRWAMEHPEALEQVFQAPRGVGAIWRILPPGQP